MLPALRSPADRCRGVMRRIVILFLTAFILNIQFLSLSFAGISKSVVTAPIPVKASLRMSLVSSVAGKKNDLRTLKSTGTDDSGSMNENSTLPNLSYFSGFGVFRFKEKHKFLVAALQSLDGAVDRTLATPFGRDFTIPGQILAARYSYVLTRELNVNAGLAYVDVFGVSDPTLGMGYRVSGPGHTGWSGRLGLKFSVPMTDRSRAEQLITRATMRSAVFFQQAHWEGHGSLSHSRPFYPHGVTPVSRMGSSNANSVSSGGHGSGHGSGQGGMAGMGSLDPVDLVLAERETNRTTAGLGGSYSLTDSFEIGAGAGLTLLETAKRSSIWLTNLRPLGLTYYFRNWEAGTNVNLFSDVAEYQHPSFPRLWAVDFRLSYTFGERSHDI